MKMMLRSSAQHSRAALAASRHGRSQVRRVAMSAAVFAHKDSMPSEAADLVESGTYKYLDVRTAGEFAQGHAPGSVNVAVVTFGPAGMEPVPTFLAQVQQAFPDKAQALVVGCKSGRRSLLACDMLSQAGYTDLVNISGGFDVWAASGLPVTK